MIRTVSEILAEVVAAEGDQAKADLLKKYDNAVLRQILKYNFDPSVVFLLPAGPVTFKRQRYDTGQTFYMEARRLKYFLAPHSTEPYHPTLSIADDPKAKEKREKMFLWCLENMNPTEADLFMKLKDKAIDEVSREIVDLAFPGLIPDDNASDLASTLTSLPKAVSKSVVATPKVTTPLAGAKSTKKDKPKPKAKPKPAKKAKPDGKPGLKGLGV